MVATICEKCADAADTSQPATPTVHATASRRRAIRFVEVGRLPRAEMPRVPSCFQPMFDFFRRWSPEYGCGPIRCQSRDDVHGLPAGRRGPAAAVLDRCIV